MTLGPRSGCGGTLTRFRYKETTRKVRVEENAKPASKNGDFNFSSALLNWRDESGHDELFAVVGKWAS